MKSITTLGLLALFALVTLAPTNARAHDLDNSTLSGMQCDQLITSQPADATLAPTALYDSAAPLVLERSTGPERSDLHDARAILFEFDDGHDRVDGLRCTGTPALADPRCTQRVADRVGLPLPDH